MRSYQWYLDAVAVGDNSVTYSYTVAGASHLVTCKVTDSASSPVTSLASNAVSVTVKAYISTSAGAGGSISPTGNVGVKYGDSQTFIITANSGYYVVDVTVNGSSVGAVSSYTFNNVQTANTISATFAPIITPTATPIPTPTASPSPTATPTTISTATPTTTSLPNQTQSQSLPQETIFGVAIVVVITALIAVVLAIRKSKKGKS